MPKSAGARFLVRRKDRVPARTQPLRQTHPLRARHLSAPATLVQKDARERFGAETLAPRQLTQRQRDRAIELCARAGEAFPRVRAQRARCLGNQSTAIPAAPSHRPLSHWRRPQQPAPCVAQACSDQLPQNVSYETNVAPAGPRGQSGEPSRWRTRIERQQQHLRLIGNVVRTSGIKRPPFRDHPPHACVGGSDQHISHIVVPV